MKKLLLALALTPTLAFGEVQPFETELPMVCGDTKNLLAGLKREFAEEIIWMAAGTNVKGDELFHSLWVSTGGTWTFLVVNRENQTTCVLASGDNYQNFERSGI